MKSKAIKIFNKLKSISQKTFNSASQSVILPFLKMVKQCFKKSKRLTAALISVIILVSTTATVVFATDATGALAVMCDGKKVAVVSAAETLAEAELLAAQKLDNAAYNKYLAQTTLSYCIASKANIVSAKALADIIIENSSQIVAAAFLTIENKVVAAEETTDILNTKLNEYVLNYKQKNNCNLASLSSSVKVAQVFTSKSDYLSLPNFAEYLKTSKNNLPIETETTVVEEVKIPYQTVKTKSSKYSLGTEKISVKGVFGIRKVTYDVVVENGKVVSKKEIASVTISEPTTQHVIVGTKKVISAEKNEGLSMVWPVKRVSRSYVSSYVGDSRGHKGMDICAPKGTPIYAATAGKVTVVGNSPSGYGKYFKIKHANGLETLYAHCSAIYVKVGQSVASGEHVAAVGTTGRSTGNHLHFEVHKNGVFTNPTKYIGRD